MPIKDMKLTPGEQKEQVGPPSAAERPKFPFGLSLHLSDETLEKLEMGNELPKVGQEMAIIGVAKVEGVSSEDTAGGKKRSHVRLQVTQLGVEQVSDAKLKRAAKVLYGDEG